MRNRTPRNVSARLQEALVAGPWSPGRAGFQGASSERGEEGGLQEQ